MDQEAAPTTGGTPAPRSLRTVFPGYFPPTIQALENFFGLGLVSFDTNALLDAYKLTGTARSEFLSALAALGKRLWIPHQVGVELLRNRASVIAQGNAFPGKFRDAAKGLHTQVQRLQEHRGLRDDEIGDLKQAIDEAIENILSRFADLYDFGVVPSSTVDDDPIFARLEQILDGKIGPPFTDPAGAEKTGLQRLKSETPPGYCDVKDKGLVGALGDTYLWEQLLLEATTRQLPVLLVTNDNKEDWVRTENGYKRGPRPELADEMLARTGQSFHLVNVRSFLFHARTILSAQVSDATLDQAESVQTQADHDTRSILERQREHRVMIDSVVGEMPQRLQHSIRRVLNGGPFPLRELTSSDYEQIISALADLQNAFPQFKTDGARRHLEGVLDASRRDNFGNAVEEDDPPPFDYDGGGSHI